MSNIIFDKNLQTNETAAENTVTWYDLPNENIDIFGVFPEKDGLLSRRIPLETAEKISQGIFWMCGYGAGGRIVFATDSPFIALKVEYGRGTVPTVCNYCFSYGFDLYKFENGKDVFVGAYRPVADFDKHNAQYKVNTHNNKKMTIYTINFPHFSEVKSLSVGIENGYSLQKGKQYINSLPVVFYGSSITHGAAAGRPGNTYENFVSQKYNLDYINLGFAGQAKGEKEMAEYITSLKMCAFVCDYDHNAPDAQHLENTHYPFYEIIRKSHPDIPYIMVTKPDFYPNNDYNAKRRAVIKASYDKAVAKGDKNVYFIDGETLFEGDFSESCTSDGCHPNDSGFSRMAEKIGKLIADALNIERI